MTLELFGKQWTLFTEKIQITNPLLMTWRTPQNMLFIPLNFHCIVTTVFGSIATVPTFILKDDTGNIFSQITTPTALAASSILQVVGLPGNVHNELLTTTFNIGFSVNTPYVECDFQLELVTPNPADTITEATIYGLIANIN